MSQPDEAPIDPLIVERASYWLMLHWQGGLDARQQAEFQRWQTQNTEHSRAWARFERLQRDLTKLPTAQSLEVLRRQPDLRRRQALKLLGAIVLAGSGALAARQTLLWRELTADLRTATGETLVRRLQDGSEIRLNTQTAVTVAYSDTERRIRLIQGEILFTTGHLVATESRPLIVETTAGEIQALGTRFSVQEADGRTLVNLYEGQLHIRPKNAPDRLLTAGQSLRFSAGEADRKDVANPNAITWSTGYLVAERSPLGQFITDLSRYRTGFLRCDERVAGLHLTGAFPIDDTDRVLASLEQALPVKVQRVTRYWVSVVPRP